MIETINKIVRTQRLLLNEIGREPTPEEISTKLNMPLEKVFPRLKAFKKHRELLGEEAYNDRVANQILSQIGKKNNKLGWIALSLREAGLIATSKVILNKDRIRKKLGR